MSEITHDVLVESARRWLCKEHCIVITEMSDGVSEKPDAIGWRAGNETTLIECKTSHSDFLSDKKKLARQGLGMGNFRYYLAPKGLISIDELPGRWGLLEYKNKRWHPRVARQPMRYQEKNWHDEMGLMCSALRRIGGLRKGGVSVKVYQIETKNTATLGVATEVEEREAEK